MILTILIPFSHFAGIRLGRSEYKWEFSAGFSGRIERI